MRRGEPALRRDRLEHARLVVQSGGGARQVRHALRRLGEQLLLVGLHVELRRGLRGLRFSPLRRIVLAFGGRGDFGFLVSTRLLGLVARSPSAIILGRRCVDRLRPRLLIPRHGFPLILALLHAEFHRMIVERRAFPFLADDLVAHETTSRRGGRVEAGFLRGHLRGLLLPLAVRVRRGHAALLMQPALHDRPPAYRRRVHVLGSHRALPGVRLAVELRSRGAGRSGGDSTPVDVAADRPPFRHELGTLFGRRGRALLRISFVISAGRGGRCSCGSIIHSGDIFVPAGGLPDGIVR